MNYTIIHDETKLINFIDLLPDLLPHEVFYLCLFGRHKYDPNFPNTKDSGQLARIIARNKQELLEKIKRLESPIGSYSRDGIIASQSALALYIALNPRSLTKANKNILIEYANRFAQNNLDFNPITVANTEIHRATDRKFFVDFDYDNQEPETLLPQIKLILPDPTSYLILKTRGGFHLLIKLDEAKKCKNFYQELAKLPGCDVKGANSLTPVPGTTQGNFIPYILGY